MESIDQIHEFLRHYKLSSSPYRMYDYEDFVRHTLTKIRNYILPNNKDLPHEDLIENIVVDNEANEILRKYEDILRVEREF